MPKRPPKKWFYRCVKKVRRKGVKDPNAVCAWLWHHRMKQTTRRRLLRGENPIWLAPALKAIKSRKTPEILKKALRKKLEEMGAI